MFLAYNENHENTFLLRLTHEISVSPSDAFRMLRVVERTNTSISRQGILFGLELHIIFNLALFAAIRVNACEETNAGMATQGQLTLLLATYSFLLDMRVAGNARTMYVWTHARSSSCTTWRLWPATENKKYSKTI